MGFLRTHGYFNVTNQIIVLLQVELTIMITIIPLIPHNLYVRHHYYCITRNPSYIFK